MGWAPTMEDWLRVTKYFPRGFTASTHESRSDSLTKPEAHPHRAGTRACHVCTQGHTGGAGTPERCSATWQAVSPKRGGGGGVLGCTHQPPPDGAQTPQRHGTGRASDPQTSGSRRRTVRADRDDGAHSKHSTKCHLPVPPLNPVKPNRAHTRLIRTGTKMPLQPQHSSHLGRKARRGGSGRHEAASEGSERKRGESNERGCNFDWTSRVEGAE